jgi:urease accessory protein
VLIVYEPAPLVAASDLRGKEEDTLALSWEQRRWVRGKFRTTGGREIALALPTGTPLEPGAVILIEEDWYVRVEPVAEPLLAVTPRGHAESIKLAFEIGNRHFPLAIDCHTILVPDDPAMTQLFDRLGIAYERRSAVFSPIGTGLGAGSGNGIARNGLADGR